MVDGNKLYKGETMVNCLIERFNLSFTQAHPGKIGHVFGYSPSLFGKRIVVHARQNCKQQTFSETKLL